MQHLIYTLFFHGQYRYFIDTFALSPNRGKARAEKVCSNKNNFQQQTMKIMKTALKRVKQATSND
jgi:hypothetical protein